MKRYVTTFLPLFLGAFFFIVSYSYVSAASYDYYVKDGSSGSGSESDPFGSIGDAIDEIKSNGGDTIFVNKGSYSGFTLPKGVELVGADQDGVIITGLVQLEHDTKISKVTVASGGSILALKSADVEIEKVHVKNALIVGIKAEEGRGTITIRDSIIEKSRKGLYMQAGNELKFEGLLVRENAEEGLDVREKVSGSIEKSEFRNNGESGIEIVLGDSNLALRSNTFSANGASGIAAQFFKGAKDVGDVRVEGNRMSKNDYGIDCKAPQGGSSKFYFLNSLRISGNTFTDNRDGEIAKSCKIMTDEERIAFEAEEKKKAEELAEAKTLTLSNEMLRDRAAKAASLRKEYDDLREVKEAQTINASLETLEALSGRIMAVEKRFASQSKTTCLFRGKEVRTEKALRLALDDSKGIIDSFQKGIDTLEFDSNKRRGEEALSRLSEMSGSIESSLDQSSCGFSLFGWVFNVVESKRAPEIIVSEEEKKLTIRKIEDAQRILFLGDMAYSPRLRKNIIKIGDDFFLGSIREELREFDLVTGGLAVPLLSDSDPLPPIGSTALLSFPTRFSNVLSSSNIRYAHLGSTFPFAKEGTESFEKTATNLSLANVQSFGGTIDGASEVKPLSQAKLSFFEYRETKIGNTEALKTSIERANESGQVVVVYFVFDRALGGSVTEERKKTARAFIDAGATLVLGSGLALPLQSEVYEKGRIAYSQGFVFDDTAVGLEKESKSLGFILELRPDQSPVIIEKALTFNETKGLTWKE